MGNDRWLLSYSALMTLLFGLFVVLYAISRSDLRSGGRQDPVAHATREALTGALPKPSSGAKFQGDAPDAHDAPDVPETKNAPDAKAASGDASDVRSQISEALREAASSGQAGQGAQTHQTMLSLEELQEKVLIGEDSRGLVIKLAARDFFPPGEAEVRPDMRPLLERLCKVLAATPHSIRVEGHTDPSEIRTVGYASDWDLAAARATGVVTQLVKRHGFDPARISAVSLSHFHPISDGDDDVSRGKNRRVEIIVYHPLKSGA